MSRLGFVVGDYRKRNFAIESRPFSRATCDADSAPHQLGEPLGNSQSQPRAAIFTRR